MPNHCSSGNFQHFQSSNNERIVFASDGAKEWEAKEKFGRMRFENIKKRSRLKT